MNFAKLSLVHARQSHDVRFIHYCLRRKRCVWSVEGLSISERGDRSGSGSEGVAAAFPFFVRFLIPPTHCPT